MINSIADFVSKDDEIKALKKRIELLSQNLFNCKQVIKEYRNNAVSNNEIIKLLLAKKLKGDLDISYKEIADNTFCSVSTVFELKQMYGGR